MTTHTHTDDNEYIYIWRWLFHFVGKRISVRRSSTLNQLNLEEGDAPRNISKRVGAIFFFTPITAKQHQVWLCVYSIFNRTKTTLTLLLLVAHPLSVFKQYNVCKSNKFGLKQQRIMGIDAERITNTIPDKRGSGGKKVAFCRLKQTKQNKTKIPYIVAVLYWTHNAHQFSLSLSLSLSLLLLQTHTDQSIHNAVQPVRMVGDVMRAALIPSKGPTHFLIEFKDKLYKYESEKAEEIVQKINYLLQLKSKEESSIWLSPNGPVILMARWSERNMCPPRYHLH